jgi:hypothetical protein
MVFILAPLWTAKICLKKQTKYGNSEPNEAVLIHFPGVQGRRAGGEAERAHEAGS